MSSKDLCCGDRCYFPINFPIKATCVLLMFQCAFVTFTGRGIIAIIQGIVGVIFAIEGFWGAVKHDRFMIRRFMVFLVFYASSSLVIGIINLQTLSDYCSTALASDVEHCHDTAQTYGYLNLIEGGIIVPVHFVVAALFFRSVIRQQGIAVDETETGHIYNIDHPEE